MCTRLHGRAHFVKWTPCVNKVLVIIIFKTSFNEDNYNNNNGNFIYFIIYHKTIFTLINCKEV